jgi:hypothetical protein
MIDDLHERNGDEKILQTGESNNEEKSTQMLGIFRREIHRNACLDWNAF